MFLQMVEADLGTFKPKRMGHLTLCQKFQTFYETEKTNLSERSMALIEQVLTKVSERNYELDFNTAGLLKRIVENHIHQVK